jgi:hypothetical protein
LQSLVKGLFQPKAGVVTVQSILWTLDARQGRGEAAIRPEEFGRFDDGGGGIGGEGFDAGDKAASFEQDSGAWWNG